MLHRLYPGFSHQRKLEARNVIQKIIRKRRYTGSMANLFLENKPWRLARRAGQGQRQQGAGPWDSVVTKPGGPTSTAAATGQAGEEHHQPGTVFQKAYFQPMAISC